jgi:anti-sigma B factor antagonist
MVEHHHLKIDEVGDVTVVCFREYFIKGIAEIDQLGEELYKLVTEQNRTKLVLNLASVQFLSSAALGKLLSLNAKLRARNGVMKFCNVQPNVLEVFVTCRLDTLFDIEQDTADALASF